MVDASTIKTLSNIPLLKTKAGPRDTGLWSQRLKEEYLSLIKVRHWSIYHMALFTISINLILDFPNGQSNKELFLQLFSNFDIMFIQIVDKILN